MTLTAFQAQLSHFNCRNNIEDVPNDVLLEIFNIFMAENRDDDATVESAGLTITAPILLSHVCQSWRTLSLNTPRMWSSINLKISASIIRGVELNTMRFENLAAGSREWLRRSGSLPIDIFLAFDSLDIGRWSSGMPIAAAAEVLTSLISQASRWRTLRIVDQGQPFLSLLAHISSWDVPIFPQFQLENSTPSRASHITKTDFPSNLLSGAQSLTAISLLDNIPLPLVPWAQIQDISLDGCSGKCLAEPGAFMGLLNTCSSLRKCRAVLNRDQSWGNAADFQAPLPDLVKCHDLTS